MASAFSASLSPAVCAPEASSCGGEDSLEGPLLDENAHLVRLPTQLPAPVGPPAFMEGILNILCACIGEFVHQAMIQARMLYFKGKHRMGYSLHDSLDALLDFTA